MKVFSSMVIVYFFLYFVTARKYVAEYTIEEVVREVDITRTIVDDEEVMLPGEKTDKANSPYPFASGLVSYKCLECICKLESNCKPIGCKQDVGSLSCGYFQIKEPYWNDCGKPGGGWKKCADDAKCASGCVEAYMKRYAPRSGCPATCETYAREHNGGPKGCKNPNTIGYWKRLKAIPGCGDV